MLEASNLGQIVGRAIYGELPAAAPAVVEPRPLPIKWRPGYRQKAVIELLRARPNLSQPEIATAIGMVRHASVALLLEMSRSGVLVRRGTRRHYSYSLSEAAHG